ncbi:hypothetical protein [Pseudohoeflea coraliihabitans]|uniref:Uncharacterized protein n=1 Tax=Pseudohoeflea coraliihabitans TaxID=2860393 RepID=A0ABS6WKW4_9HYPH|nr:hypothetical protein [Pseudohoeflea sp. DP4N28-3]MBW3096586.1 hypothetical protein [Pseudohoeflea sp. DP4N28-3]
MLAAIPLMIIPFLIYNGILLDLAGDLFIFGADPMVTDMGADGVGATGITLGTTLLSVPMLSGAVWEMSLGDLLIVVALLILFLEILKATRAGAGSVRDHLLSMLVFVAFLVEFLLVADAATDVFFILMVIAFIDVIAGFSVSIRSARRDVSIGL